MCLKRIHFKVDKPHPKSLPQGEGLVFDSALLANSDCTHSPSRSTSGARGWVNLQWKEFRIGDLFSNIQQGARLKQADHIKGNLAFVMSGTENTGISGFIGNENARKFKANALTIDIFGNVFYRNYDFGASDDVGVFWNDKNPIKEKAMFFLCAVIAKSLRGRFDFGHKLRASQSHDIKIPLPINKNGQIDFDFMESFISAVQKEVIKGVVLWSEKRINATKEVIQKH